MNKQIAGEIGVSEITVKVHRSGVMHKMSAKSLADLVRMADVLGVGRIKSVALHVPPSTIGGDENGRAVFSGREFNSSPIQSRRH
jgi:hypothetical protein